MLFELSHKIRNGGFYNEKIVGMIMAIGICICSITSSAYAKEDDITSELKNVQEEILLDSENTSTKANSTWVDWAKTAIKWIIYKIDNAVYNVSASKEIGSNYVRVSPGSIEYNNGKNGSSSYIDIVARSPYMSSGNPNMSISLSTSCSLLTGLRDVMSVTLTNPSGSYVINTTLGMNGIKAYGITKASAQGTYRATYAVTENQKWTTTATIFDSNTPTRTFLDIDDREVVIDWEHNKYYYIPTEDVLEENTMLFNSEFLSVDQLYEQFWDCKLGEYVYNLKNFNVGDNVIVSDLISGISYDSENDRTILEFNTSKGTAYWPFDGNLLEQYSVGDRVTFAFKVVQTYMSGEFVFESLDYFQHAENKLFDSSVSVNITDYLE